MRCLVLGGTGFIGQHLVAALVAAGHDVSVLSRSAGTGRTLPKVAYIAADFRDRSALESANDGVEIVYHLIGMSLPATSNADAPGDVQGNVVSTLGVLEEARHARVRRVVFVSSGGTVYGDPRELPIPESHATDPLCSYGITKLTIEKYLHAYQRLHGLDYRVMRLANPYGPGQRLDRPQGVITAFLDRALREVPIEIWGTGEVIRDYVFIHDTARAIAMAGSHEGPSRVFNVGSGAGLSLNALLRAIGRVLGREPEVVYQKGRSFDVPANVLDVKRAGEELGWTAQTPLHEGLRLTAAWLRERSAVAG